MSLFFHALTNPGTRYALRWNCLLRGITCCQQKQPFFRGSKIRSAIHNFRPSDFADRGNYVQAKRWQGNVGREAIQSFVGALAGKHATKGVFITTSGFNSNATAYAQNLPQKIILIDGKRLAELMIEHGIGVSEEHAYRTKKIDSDYFDEG